jgi:hypothetical protein
MRQESFDFSPIGSLQAALSPGSPSSPKSFDNIADELLHRKSIITERALNVDDLVRVNSEQKSLRKTVQSQELLELSSSPDRKWRRNKLLLCHGSINPLIEKNQKYRAQSVGLTSKHGRISYRA